MSIENRKRAERNLNRRHILTSYDIADDPTVDNHTRLSYCLKLVRMGVRDDMLPTWCNSAEALDLFHRAHPVSLLGKPESARQSAKPTGNPDFDALAGGRSRRILRTRRPKKTMKKNRKRMTRKK